MEENNYARTFKDYLLNDCEDRATASNLLVPGESPASICLDKCYKTLDNLLKEGRQEDAEKWVDKIDKLEQRFMETGDLELTYEGAEKVTNEQFKKYLTKDQLKIVNLFDSSKDADLIASYVLGVVPEIKCKINPKVLYKACLMIGSRKKSKGKAKHQNYEPEKEVLFPEERSLLPENLEEMIKDIPKNDFKQLPEESIEEQREYTNLEKLRILLQKKAEREIFPVFLENEEKAYKLLDNKVKDSDIDENLVDVYRELVNTYMGYSELELEDVNPGFEHPLTKEKRVLPSLHQKIGIYHLLKEKRFGFFDGCGTGKTAQAVLGQPLIKKQLESEGKKLRKTIVVCPNTAKKAWKKGLIGEDDERYLADKQNIAVVNPDQEKDSEFLGELKDKDWVVLNYEQLTTNVNGSGTLFVDELIKLSFDYVIFDESHRIKNQKEETATGKPSWSAAARKLANSSEYLCLLTGTPIPDTLNDYAVLYHLLNPEDLPDISKFEEIYESNARALYTLFNKKSIRRTSEDINRDLECEEEDEFVELTKLQRLLYNHVLENSYGKDWLHQARKALLDPRLVDPEILHEAGLLGKITHRDSAKYNKLEEILCSGKGPIENGEKFIIFSKYQKGVTGEEIETLKIKYKKLSKKLNNPGIMQYFENLNFDKTLDKIVLETLEKKYGRKFNIGVIDGRIKEIEQREKIVSDLGNGLSGILCTIETGGESLDFTGASYGIFLEEDFSPRTMDQAIPRLVRPGQKNTVKITHLRGKNTLDEQLKEYVERKRIINRMAMDGLPLTNEEIQLLENTKDAQRFKDLIQSAFGGKSINVAEADSYLLGLDSFEVKRRGKHRKRNGLDVAFVESDGTGPQLIRQLIAMDPVNCWKDPSFVELYMKHLNELSVPVIHRAKVTDLLNRSLRGEVEFPGKILSEGSGPSILYNTYNVLEDLVKESGYKIPMIVDRDSSWPMLQGGKNSNQIFGTMTGKNSVIKDNSFDMIDNESITLLRNDEQVKDSLLEANRILKQNGLLSLITKNLKFSDEFYSGLEGLGFEVLSGKNQGFNVSKKFLNHLKRKMGERYATAYASKLANTHLLLAQKKDKPVDAPSHYFWFDKIEGLEPEEIGIVRNPSESRSIIVPGGRRGRRKRNRDIIFNPKKEVKVDRYGNVVSVKDIER